MPDTMITEQPTVPLPRNRSLEIDKLAGALAKAQAAMEGAKKAAENPGFKRDGKNATYADLASVWDAIREPLGGNGLSVVQLPATLENGVEIETIMLHESGQFIRNNIWMPCGQTMTAHTIGSAITYGRRYALMAMVGIAPEDDDGNAASGVSGDGHKPGAPGSAGGGAQFRPEHRQMPAQSSAHGRELAASEPDLVDHSRPKGQMPKPGGPTNPRVQQAANALELATWCKESIEGFKNISTKQDLVQWWKDNHEKRGDVEEKMPADYDRMLVAYDARMDTVAAKGA